MALELTIYTDESKEPGRFYSNFYGGALVSSAVLEEVQGLLQARKEELHLFREVKWQKVTAQYLSRYVGLMDCFFDLVAADKIKVRIMFTNNANRPRGLSREQSENAYFLLYYQFIKHAFGLVHSNPTDGPMLCRFYFDRVSEPREKVARFKSYLAALSHSAEFRRTRIRLDVEQMAEVDSHHHVVLQCLDIVLGSMPFRLNDKHLEMPPGARCRGKKTRAKEQLYRHINRRIRAIYPHFNIGMSTGLRGKPENRWRDPYRHWLFLPRQHERTAGN